MQRAHVEINDRYIKHAFTSSWIIILQLVPFDQDTNLNLRLFIFKIVILTCSEILTIVE